MRNSLLRHARLLGLGAWQQAGWSFTRSFFDSCLRTFLLGWRRIWYQVRACCAVWWSLAGVRGLVHAIEGLLQTGCRHWVIQAARSIPDVDMGRLSVGNVPPISMIGASAPAYYSHWLAIDNMSLSLCRTRQQRYS